MCINPSDHPGTWEAASAGTLVFFKGIEARRDQLAGRRSPGKDVQWAGGLLHGLQGSFLPHQGAARGGQGQAVLV